MTNRLRLALLISGGGTTLRNLIEQRDNQRLNVDFRLVISSSAKAGGLKHAEDAQIPTSVLRQSDFATAEVYSDAVFQAINVAGADLVVMGGFLKFLPIPDEFANRVINIHPSLIPAFCGQGFYGLRVHQAVLDYGAKVTGCTVHFVDNEYDHGPIILQRVVPVKDGDTANSVARRVFEAECDALPDALRLFADGRLSVEGRVVKCSSR